MNDICRILLYGVAIICSTFSQTAEAAPALELALVVDVSGSIDDQEFDLQRTGYSNAFRSTDVKQAIARLGRDGISVTLVYFSTSATQAVEWTLIRNAADADAFADAIDNAARDSSGSTGIGTGIEFATSLFQFDSPLQVIDVSGDGENNSGIEAATARDAAIAAGIDQINGLAIQTDVPDLLTYYQANVVSGVGSFGVAVASFTDLESALQLKLASELTTFDVVLNSFGVRFVSGSATYNDSLIAINSPCEVTVSIQNRSLNAPARNLVAEVYLSSNRTFGEDDFLIGQFPLPDLQALGSETVSGIVLPPLTVPANQYFGRSSQFLVRIAATPPRDRNELNNVKSLPIEIVDPSAVPKIVLNPISHPAWFFPTREEAVEYVRSQGFESNSLGALFGDPGFSRPATTRTSYHNGKEVPAGAFRIQLTPIVNIAGRFGPGSIQGADDSFNPFAAAVPLPEPSPPSTGTLLGAYLGSLFRDFTWGSYVRRYHLEIF